MEADGFVGETTILFNVKGRTILEAESVEELLASQTTPNSVHPVITFLFKVKGSIFCKVGNKNKLVFLHTLKTTGPKST
jgi:hypothetical protein